jgi:hypothetical protein
MMEARTAGRPLDTEARAAFDRAFVAMSYLLERRGADLLSGLEAPSPAAVELARRLGHPEREARARVLAPELGRLAAALEVRRFR